jgi:Ca2+:H+ antiporter
VSARLQAGLLFLATIALLIPSAISHVDSPTQAAFSQKLSLGLAVILISAYALGMLSRSGRTATSLAAPGIRKAQQKSHGRCASRWRHSEPLPC